jgi:tRNA threonylcarbamoyladenosine biosynthesis protein TsaB
LYVLGIDTATPVTSVAIGSQTGILAAASIRQDRGHARLLAPTIKWLLEQAELESSAIACVAVGTGPGLFSGLRVGVGTAKALAQSWQRPMVAIPSLDLLAFNQRYAPRPVCAVIDGRRGEVFAALYKHVPGGMVRLTEPQVLKPEELAAAIQARGEHVLFVGDGAIAYRSVFERSGARIDLGTAAQSAPSAEALVELAVPQFQREEFVNPFEVSPLYLRRPDIDPNVEQRAAIADADDGVEV